MQGLHLTADLHQCRCDPARLTDATALLAACLGAVTGCGLYAVGQLSHSFPRTGEAPVGVTATVLLAESHLCVHTWPEQRAVTLDVYVCNVGADHSSQARALLETLLGLFQPQHIERHSLLRGTVGQPASPATGMGPSA